MVILDSIAELTVMIQGAESNYIINETTFLMKELVEIIYGDILSTHMRVRLERIRLLSTRFI